MLRVRGLNVALHWLYKNVQTPEAEEQNHYDRNHWSKTKFKRAGGRPAPSKNNCKRLSFGGCAFDYAIDEQQDDGAYD